MLLAEASQHVLVTKSTFLIGIFGCLTCPRKILEQHKSCASTTRTNSVRSDGPTGQQDFKVILTRNHGQRNREQHLA